MNKYLTRITVAFFALFFFFFFFVLVNGYPVFYPDIEAYLFEGMTFTYNTYQNVLITGLIFPFFYLAGFWGWLLSNCLIASYVLAKFKISFLNKLPLSIYLLSLYLSLYVLMVMTLIMDFYMTIGFISIFAIFSGKKEKIYPVLLVLATLSHYAHVVVFFVIALVYAFVYKLFRQLKLITILILLCLFLSGIFSFMTVGKFQTTSSVAPLRLASRVMYDLPNTITEYAEHNPNTYFAEKADDFLDFSKISDTPSDLFWHEESPIRNDHLTILGDCWQYIFFTIYKHPFEHIKAAVHNVFKQIVYLRSYIPYLTENPKQYGKYVDFINQYDAKTLQAFKNSKFIKGDLSFIEPVMLSKLMFYLSLFVNLFVLVACPKEKDFFTYRFSLFSLLALFVTIVFMANLSEPDMRYVVRASTLLYISTASIIYNLFKGVNLFE